MTIEPITPLDNAVGWQIWQVLAWVIAGLLVAAGVVTSVRQRRLSTLLLMTLGGASCFWLETYGNWGGYVLYSAHFARMTWWGDTPFTSPVKAWWFIAGYAFFYPAQYGLMLGLLRLVQRRRPDVNRYVAAVALALPVFYVFDILFEGVTTALGFWSYTESFGPHIQIGIGSFPLLWPIILQAPFLALAAIALIWRDDEGRDVFHRFVRRVPAGWGQESAVALTWMGATNIALIVTVFAPMVLVRIVFGGPSALVP